MFFFTIKNSTNITFSSGKKNRCFLFFFIFLTILIHLYIILSFSFLPFNTLVVFIFLSSFLYFPLNFLLIVLSPMHSVACLYINQTSNRPIYTWIIGIYLTRLTWTRSRWEKAPRHSVRYWTCFSTLNINHQCNFADFNLNTSQIFQFLSRFFD